MKRFNLYLTFALATLVVSCSSNPTGTNPTGNTTVTSWKLDFERDFTYTCDPNTGGSPAYDYGYHGSATFDIDNTTGKAVNVKVSLDAVTYTTPTNCPDPVRNYQYSNPVMVQIPSTGTATLGEYGGFFPAGSAPTEAKFIFRGTSVPGKFSWHLIFPSVTSDETVSMAGDGTWSTAIDILSIADGATVDKTVNAGLGIQDRTKATLHKLP